MQEEKPDWVGPTERQYVGFQHGAFLGDFQGNFDTTIFFSYIFFKKPKSQVKCNSSRLTLACV